MDICAIGDHSRRKDCWRSDEVVSDGSGEGTGFELFNNYRCSHLFPSLLKSLRAESLCLEDRLSSEHLQIADLERTLFLIVKSIATVRIEIMSFGYKAV